MCVFLLYKSIIYYYIPSVVGARDIYERAVEFFGEENADEKLFLAFGKFEENCKEVRAVSMYSVNSTCNKYKKLASKPKGSKCLYLCFINSMIV